MHYPAITTYDIYCSRPCSMRFNFPFTKNLPDIVACQGGLVFSGLSENGVQRTNAILSAGSP